MNLPEFTVKRFHIDAAEGSYDMLEVTCPRTGCGRTHWVAASWCAVRYVQGREGEPAARVVGRPCPWCSAASAIPEALRVEPSAPRKKRRVKTRVRK
jgi:hypothetical protein